VITASAIRVIQDGKEPFIVTGYRHCNCFETIHEMGIRRPFVDEQGFVTDEGNFLTRHQAKVYAERCGQIKAGEGQYRELYSEDLW
jgi:hypothetical protein